MIWNIRGICETKPCVRIYEDGNVALSHAKLAVLLQKKPDLIIKRHLNFPVARSYVESKMALCDFWVQFLTLPVGYRDQYVEN